MEILFNFYSLIFGPVGMGKINLMIKFIIFFIIIGYCVIMLIYEN